MSAPAGSVKFLQRILVVEDDYLLADLLADVLTYENCVPDIAVNGIEALDKLRSSDYTAVICDLMLPGLDGENIYHETVKTYPYLADKFLFITGQVVARAGLTDFIYRTGNPLLQKPFEIDEFRDALRELLAR